MRAENVMARPDYGIDSPAIVASILAAGVVAGALAVMLGVLNAAAALTIAAAVIGAYFILYSASMVRYSRSGKQVIRDRLLAGIPWQGDEAVLDVCCGPPRFGLETAAQS